MALNASTKRIILHDLEEYEFNCNSTYITRFLTFEAREKDTITLLVNGYNIMSTKCRRHIYVYILKNNKHLYINLKLL